MIQIFYLLKSGGQWDFLLHMKWYIPPKKYVTLTRHFMLDWRWWECEWWIFFLHQIRNKLHFRHSNQKVIHSCSIDCFLSYCCLLFCTCLSWDIAPKKYVTLTRHLLLDWSWWEREWWIFFLHQIRNKSLGLRSNQKVIHWCSIDCFLSYCCLLFCTCQLSSFCHSFILCSWSNISSSFTGFYEWSTFCIEICWECGQGDYFILTHYLLFGSSW